MREVISTQKAPAAIGPYSQGIKVGDLLFISGQLGVNMENGEIAYESVEDQVLQALKNLQAIAEAAGSGLDKAVRVTVYLTDLNDFQKMNSIYAKFFTAKPPARACVQVGRLPKDAAVEIDAICVCE